MCSAISGMGWVGGVVSHCRLSDVTVSLLCAGCPQ